MKSSKTKGNEVAQPISIRLPEDIKALADEFLKNHDTSLSNLISVALFALLKSNDGEREKVFYRYLSRTDRC